MKRLLLRISGFIVVWTVVMTVGTAALYYYGAAKPTDCRDWRQEFANGRDRLSVSTSSNSERIGLLTYSAKAGAQIGELEAAEQYASEALRSLPSIPRDWNYGNVIHDAHAALGLVALRRGDMAQAEAHLLAAGKTPGSPQLNSFGPNMTLASELLKVGRRDAVITYLKHCENFWEMGGQRLRRWQWMARWGIHPDFGANFLF